jgi:flagellar basal body P-ring formation protein FlgA
MWRVLILLLPGMASAESLIAVRTIRAQSVISAEDVSVVDAVMDGVVLTPAAAIGQEARVTIYAGRAVLLADLGPAAVVDRNQLVPLRFQAGTLAIMTEGRALERGAEGDVIRIMNLSSRLTVTGRVMPDGSVNVGTMP